MLNLDPKKIRAAAFIGNAVLTKAVMIIIGFWGGGKLDQKFGTTPWFMFLCGFGSIGLGIWYLLLVMKRLQKSGEDNGE